MTKTYTKTITKAMAKTITKTIKKTITKTKTKTLLEFSISLAARCRLEQVAFVSNADLNDKHKDSPLVERQ